MLDIGCLTFCATPGVAQVTPSYQKVRCQDDMYKKEGRQAKRYRTAPLDAPSPCAASRPRRLEILDVGVPARPVEYLIEVAQVTFNATIVIKDKGNRVIFD